MSTDKPTLDRLMEMPRKELVDDAVFYHDGWIAAGREYNKLKAENAKLRDDLETQRETAWHNTKRNAREYKRVCNENAKLREELAKWEQLTAGIDLPEYPVTQFKPKDLERENEKLRESLRDIADHIKSDDGYGIDSGWVLERIRETGIEVK